MRKRISKLTAGLLASAAVLSAAVSPAFAFEYLTPDMFNGDRPAYGNHPSVDQYDLVEGRTYVADWDQTQGLENHYMGTSRHVFRILKTYEDYYLGSFSEHRLEAIDLDTGEKVNYPTDLFTFYEYDEQIGWGAFITPRDAAAKGKQGDVRWYLSADGVLHLEDGNMLLDEKHGTKPFEPYASQIRQISVDNIHGIGKVSLVGDASKLFKNMAIDSFDSYYFDTSNTTNMNSMFYRCLNLKEMDLSHFDTSKAEDLSAMFYGCENLKSLDLSSFDDSQAKEMRFMFYGCDNLESLNASSLSAGSAVSLYSMFNGCAKLQELDLSGLKAFNVTDARRMFMDCPELKTINLSSMATMSLTQTEEMFLNTTHLETLTFKRPYLFTDTSISNLFPQGNLYFTDHAEMPGIYERDKIKDLFANVSDEDTFTAHMTSKDAQSKVIYLHSNFGEDQVNVYSIVSDQALLPENTFFTNEGKDFLGWSTQPNGSKVLFNSKQTTASHYDGQHLYAQWTPGKLHSANLEFGSDLKVNFLFELDASAEADSSAKVMFKRKNDQKAASVPLCHMEKDTDSVPGKTLYKLTQTVTAKQYAQPMEVWVQTKAADTRHETFTLKDYAKTVLEDETTDAKTKKLLSSFLLYGDSVLSYEQHQTKGKGLEGLTLDQEAENFAKNIKAEDVAAFEPKLSCPMSLKTIKAAETKIEFSPKASAKFIFESSYGQKALKNIKAEWNGQNLDVVQEKDGRFSVSVSNLEGKAAADVIQLKLTDTQTGKSMDFSFGLHTELFEALESGKSSGKLDLLKNYYTYTHYLAEKAE